MQYQFVVMYDSRTEQWQVDVPSLGDLNDRIMYDEEQQEWLYQGEPGYAVHESIYRDVEDELAKILAPHSLDDRQDVWQVGMSGEIIITECNSSHEWIGDPLYCSACGVDKGNEVMV